MSGDGAESLLARLAAARQRPDFEAWHEGLRLAPDPDRPDRLRLATAEPVASALHLALDEIALALAGAEAERPNLDALARVVLLARAIARGERPHGYARMVRSQFDYFERHLAANAALSLADLPDGWPAASAAAHERLIRDCIYELIRNLWSWLRDRDQLPLITEPRIESLLEEARQALGTDEPVATVREVVKILRLRVEPEGASDLTVELARRRPGDMAALALQAKYGDPWATLALARSIEASGRADEPALADLRLYAVADLPGAEAKALFLQRWDTVVADARRLAIGLGLPWTAAEKERIRRLCLDAAASRPLPRPALEVAACRLMAWGYEAAGAELVGGASGGDKNALGLMIELMRDGTIPKLPDDNWASIFDGSSIVHHRVDGAESAIVFFVGINDMPVEAFHRLLASFGTHVFYIKDPTRLLCYGGIPPLADSYAGTIAALKALFEREGIRHLHLIGRSGGALSAIRYGVDLGAATVQGFGAATRIDEPFMRTDRRANSVLRRMRAITPEAAQDLRRVVEAAAAPPRIVLTYSEHYDRDVRHAENFRGLSCAELVELEGTSEHDAFVVSLAKGDFVPRMTRYLAGDLAPRGVDRATDPA